MAGRRAPPMSPPSPIVDVAAVPHVHDIHDESIVINVVEHAVVPHAETPSVTADKLLTTWGPGVHGKAFNSLDDGALNVPFQLSQILDRAWVPFDEHSEA